MAKLTSFKVGTSAVPIANVPAGRTITIQNVGTAVVTISVDVPAVAGRGIMLASGKPGGSLVTQPPGDTSAQVWWAITATGTTTVSVLVV